MKITIKTSTVDWADSRDPIFIKICNDVDENQCCETQLNDPRKTNFQKGQVDVFEGNLLNQCQTFPITNEIKTVQMRLEKEDGWRGEYVIIGLSNEIEVKCPITTWVNQARGEMTLTCGPIWTNVNGKNYWVSEVAASQPEATETCNEMGAYLAEPTTAKENEGIAKMVADKQQGINLFWIGVDDIAKEARYTSILKEFQESPLLTHFIIQFCPILHQK